MFHLFIDFLTQSSVLYWRLIFTARPPPGLTIKHRLILLLLFPMFFIWQSINWLGLFLDELFFRDYKSVEIQSPVFILGIPRSGTTFLHRLLAKDQQFTTLSTWECLFAPSITQRKFFQALAVIDHKIGNPLQRLSQFLLSAGSKKLDAIHSVSLQDAEEDYLLMLPVLAAFILVVPFPQERRFWDLAYFDSNVDKDRKEALLDFYEACLQRHVYAHKKQTKLLSKNASLLSWQQDLATRFPDARFIICTRAPDDALGSQLSAIQPGIDFFRENEALYQQAFVDVFEHYYQLIYKLFVSDLQHAVMLVRNADLRVALYRTITEIYERFDLPMNDAFKQILIRTDHASKKYQSTHQYDTPKPHIATDALVRLNEYYHSIITSDYKHANSAH